MTERHDPPREGPDPGPDVRAAREQELLSRVSRILAATLDLDAVLQAIADGAAELLGVESSAIYILEPGDQLYLGATLPPLDPEMPDSLRRASLSDHPHILQAVSSGEPVLVQDAREAELSAAERQVAELRELRSLIYLPFQHEDRVVGVLILGTTSGSRTFSDRDLDLCRTLAGQLALGVQNARLHTRLLEHAARLEAEVEERTRAEQALRRSEERFRALFEQAGDYILLMEIGKGGWPVIVDANQAACETHGFSLDQLKGLPIRDLDRGLTPGQMEEILESLNAGEQVLFETVHRRKDGSEFPVEVSAKALDLGDGRIHLLSIERDISERRRWERELMRHQRAITLNHAVARIFLTADPKEADSKIMETLMAGFSSDLGLFGAIDPAGNLVFNLMARDDSGAPRLLESDRSLPPGSWTGPWSEVLRDRKTLLFSQDFELPGGPPALKTGLLSPLIYSDTLIGLLGVADKPDGYDEEDRALIASVADQIAPILWAHRENARQERERQSIEEQLRQAQKMDAVGKFAGGVAHDFKNLLHVIQGQAELVLLSVPPGSPVGEAMGYVMDAAERAATLVQRLLTFSRQEVPQRRPMDLAEVVADLTKMIRRVIGEDIHLEVGHGRGSAVIKADPGHIEQILLNLCVNARDAMPHGGSITITTERIHLNEREALARGLDQPGSYVRLTVWDTGVGMDEDTLEHVFEPFFTTKQPGKGTGLGLTTAYGLIRKHGGAVQVHSEVGRGTTFRIYFPHHASQAPSREIEKKIAPPGGTETILLAEDDDKVRSLSEFILTNAGYSVYVASDGKEAIDLFARLGGRVDLLILDAVMPRLGGRAVHERARERGFRGPVLFASGYAPESETPDLLKDEQVQLLQKPFTRNELLHRVRKALDGESRD